jgi:hypothetical protein
LRGEDFQREKENEHPTPFWGPKYFAIASSFARSSGILG